MNVIFFIFSIHFCSAIHDQILESAGNNFTGFKVYEVLPINLKQVEFIEKLDNEVIIWLKGYYIQSEKINLLHSFMISGVKQD